MKQLLLLCFLFLLQNWLYAQMIQNAGFETGTISHWQLANPAFYGYTKDPGYACTVEKTGGKRNYVARLSNTGSGVWCQLRQTVTYPADEQTQKVRVGVYVRTADMQQGYVSLVIMPMAHGKRYGVIESKKEKANNGWKLLTAEAVLPPHTDSVKIYCGIYGDGTAWFDDVSMHQVQGSTSRSPEAARYLDTAISVIGKHALYKDSVDFKELAADAALIATYAQTTSDCYSAIRYLLEGLNDHHSFFRNPDEAILAHNEDESKITYPSGKVIHDSIGYLLIPGFSGISGKLAQLYADSLQAIIRSLDTHNQIAGWIVDVRNNLGGNGFPMELGLGPVIGNGVSDRKIKNGVVTDSSGYWDGELRYNNEVAMKVAHPYTLRQPYPFVAVLTSRNTASSGEGVVLRFKHRPNTRIFGEPTWGNTSANEEFLLPDGAAMFVATRMQTDRLGNGYGGKIEPDVAVSDDDNTRGDEAIDKAVKWLCEYAHQ